MEMLQMMTKSLLHVELSLQLPVETAVDKTMMWESEEVLLQMGVKTEC